VLLVLGSVLLTRLAAWVRGRMIGHVDAQDDSTESLVRSEEAKHRHALIQVITWVVLVLVYCVAAVLVVARLGIPLTGLVAPATIVGVAFGLDGQRIVQDVLAGFFIIAERQYGFGDLVRVSTTGVVGDATGTVEDVNLRVTRLRSVDGEVIIVPIGQISRTTNLSRDWARAVIDVPIPATVGVGRATEILQKVGVAAYNGGDLRALLLDAPTVMGVETIEVDEFRIRMVARTLPGKQFAVGRELRTRVAVAFRREGMTVPADLDTAQSTGSCRRRRRRGPLLERRSRPPNRHPRLRARAGHPRRRPHQRYRNPRPRRRTVTVARA
jgi:small conductance mechanosensitive channel